MPLYDYVCLKCEHVWEESHKMDDRHKPTKGKCPNCKKKGKIEQKVGAKIADPIAIGVSGPSSSFKDLMNNAANQHPRGNLGHWKK